MSGRRLEKTKWSGRITHSQPAPMVLQGYIPWDSAPPQFSVLYSEGPGRRFLRGALVDSRNARRHALGAGLECCPRRS